MWEGYHSQRWRNLRARILKRDGYMSAIAIRYGKHVEADTVHHCWPAEEFPQYAWEPWNLISITQDEHRELHNSDGTLTPAGETWRRRRSPPGRGEARRSAL